MNQVKLSFGYKEGKIVDISEVEKGLACGCVCPACNSRLIANKGSKNRHHFKHHRTDECKGYGETLLHLAAKQIIVENREICFPIFDIRTGDYTQQNTFHYSNAEEEKRVEDVIPDTILYFQNDHQVFVEIKVTHEVDEEKYQKLKKIGVSTLEIDLSHHLERKNDVINLNELRHFVLYISHKRKWVYDKNYIKNIYEHKEFLEMVKFSEVMDELTDEYWRNIQIEQAEKKRLSFYNKNMKGFLRKTKFTGLFGYFYLEDHEIEVRVYFEDKKSKKYPALKYILTKYKFENSTYQLPRLGALFENNGKLTGTISIEGDAHKIELIKTNKIKKWDYEIRVRPNTTYQLKSK